MAAPRSAMQRLRTFSAALRQPGLRSSSLVARQTLRQQCAQTARQLFQRRFQTTVAEGADASGQSAFQKLLNSPVGPKTVHFWAPIMKWGVVLAGVSDFARPAQDLSLSQNLALMLTGSIWTRWCFIIKPKNYFLATVNFFLFCVGFAQVTRVIRYRRRHSDKTLFEDIKEGAVAQKDNLLKKIGF